MVMKEDDEEEKDNYVGRTVKKFFSGFGFFHGKVVSFNRARKFYKVKYDDGDREELELKELREILVGEWSQLSQEKPKGKRGRKRRRDSTDKDEPSVAGNSIDSPGGQQDKMLGYNSAQQGREFLPSQLEEGHIFIAKTKEMLRQSGNNDEAGELSGQQEDEHLLEPLVPISLSDAFEKSVKQSGCVPGQSGEEGAGIRAGECGKPVLADSTSPCRLKRTRVTPASDTLLQLMPDGEDKGDRNKEAETVTIEETAKDTANVPVPNGSIDADAPEIELDSGLQQEKNGSGERDKQDDTQYSSLVLSLPPSSKSMGALDHCVAELFQVYGLLRSFSNTIFLSPFSLEEFAYSLTTTDVCSMIDCVHLSLMQTLRRQLERLSKNGSKSATFTLRLSDWSLLDYITWPSFLVGYLLTQGFSFERGQSSVKAGLSTVEYYRLPVRTKLIILSFLCDKVLDTEEARAEIARRVLLENDPEAMESKGCLQKKQAKERTDVDPLDELSLVHSASQGKDMVSVQPEVQEFSSPSVANSIRVGRHLDEDGSLDECVLCAMDGNLICCDGCPAAYHSRCVGVTKQGLPPGDWFCPECRADKQDPRGARISKRVRGGELLVVGPDGQSFFYTCGYLLISESGPRGQAINRFYGPRDLPKVMAFLEEAGPIYSQLHIAVQELWQAGTDIASKPDAGQNLSSLEALPIVSSAGNKPGRHEMQFSSLEGEVPINQSVHISGSLISDQTEKLDFDGTYLSTNLTNCEASVNPVSRLWKEEREINLDLHACDTYQVNGVNTNTDAVSLLAGQDEKNPHVCYKDLEKSVHGENLSQSPTINMREELENIWSLHASNGSVKQIAMGTIPSKCDKQTTGDVRTGNFPQFVMSSNPGVSSAEALAGENGIIGLRDTANGAMVSLEATQVVHHIELAVNASFASSAMPFSEQKDRHPSLEKQADVRTQKNGKSSYREVDYMSTLTQINACAYSNKYSNCDLVATAAFNLAAMAGGIDDLVDDKSGTMKKLKPSSAADQMKAFTQASSHFFWPSSKKRAKDVPKEKCGWCINCRAPVRRGCLLTQVAGQMTGGAAFVVGGIRPIKGGYGHFPAVAAYILYMEESLRGLLVGPWESSGHRKKWRKQVEQPKSLEDVKLALLQMESSLRNVVLSPDWDKVEEDAPESIANSVAIISAIGMAIGKKNSSKKRGRPPVVTKSPAVNSYDGACFGVNWWRGGSLSRIVYNWESLSRTAIRRAGRQGGVKEIADLVYSKNFDLPRRTRRVAWRTRLEKISSVAQVAVEVRYLDTFIKWNDIISPLEASSTHHIKGPVESDPAYWKAEIQAKSEESGTVKYLLDFTTNKDEKTSSVQEQEEVPVKVVGNLVEKPTNKKHQAEGGSNEGLKEVWVTESDVPLFLLKDFEEKTRIVSQSNVPKAVKKGKVKGAILQKKMSFWKMLCSSRLAGVLESKKLSSWICGYCKLSCSESQCVKCQRCSGEFHSNCTQVEDSIDGREKVSVCRSCIRLRLGQRMRKPSYKMLIMQSQLTDGSPSVGDKEGLVSNNTEAAPAVGVKLRWKKDRLTDSTSQPEHGLTGRKKKKKKRLLSVPTPSELHYESVWMDKKGSRKKKKKKKKGLIAVMSSQHEGESATVGKRKYSKRKKNLPTEVSQAEGDEGINLPQPKKRGRKRKIISLVPSQAERIQDVLPQARRTSGRIRNSISPNATLLVPDDRVQQHGKRKSGYKLDKELFQPLSVSHLQHTTSMTTRRRTGRSHDRVPATVAAQHDDDGVDSGKEQSVKRRRLKIIFAGLPVGGQDRNNNAGDEIDQKRRSGNGLDFGCRSARSEADIQRFRQDRIVLAGQVGLDEGNTPVCSLCSEPYVPGQVYVSCEYCKEWFHGAAVGLKPADAAYLVGFKCHRCRKCRAPACPGLQNVGVKSRRRGAIDPGEVIDAENVNRTGGLALRSSLQSSWFNSPDKEFSAFSDSKAFPDFVAATNQAEEALAADGSNFGHDVLSRDFDMTDLVLPEDSQLQVNPSSLEGQQVNVWADNSSAQLDLPVLSVSHAHLSSQGAPSLSFSELLASEDDYFEGVAGPGLGLSAEWSGGMYDGSGSIAVPCKPSEAASTGVAGLDKHSPPLDANESASQMRLGEKNSGNNNHSPPVNVNESTSQMSLGEKHSGDDNHSPPVNAYESTSQISLHEKNSGNDSYAKECASVTVSRGEDQKLMNGNSLSAVSR